MIIPKRDLEGFVREISDQCFSTRVDRQTRGEFFQNYYASGSEDPSNPALFNKTFAAGDDLISLLYSPVTMRFKLSDPDLPGPLSGAKNRAAAARLRSFARKSETDTMISAAVESAIVKGKSFIKQWMKGREFVPTLVQPEDMGVLRENCTTLDEDMEAFAHRMMITPWQFHRLVAGRDNARELIESAKNYTLQSTGDDKKSASKQITVGGMYPFRAGSEGNSNTRGLVDWLSQPRPDLSPEVANSMLEMHELWVWDDDREDWATFQIIGKELLVLGKLQILNALAYDTETHQSAPMLKGEHPFREFCINPVNDYFWGRSELSNLVALQEMINSRLAGINKLLRRQEDPPTKFIGSTGVNQTALSRYNKPGGYWTDQSPTAKIERDKTDLPQDLFGSLHEYERMFDEIMGKPPVTQGKGDKGVRSHQHAAALVSQASPRFKDRALLVERSVEALGGLMLDLARAHDDRKIIAWVAEKEAGLEGVEPDALTPPPAPGLVAVPFRFADLPENTELRVNSHSSSPAFAQQALDLDFDLLKVGAMSPSDLLDNVDTDDPASLQAEIVRRDIAKAEAEQHAEELKAATKLGGGRH